MNKDVLKKIKENNKKNYVKEWWWKNGDKVLKIILFPIWIIVWTVDKIKDKIYLSTEWDEERAIKILNYYVPRNSGWEEETKSLYFFDNGYGWSCNIKKIKRKDRVFWKKYCNRIKKVLIDKFELEGFSKCKGDCSLGWTEITFKMN